MPAQQQPSIWRRIQQWLSGGSALPESRKHQMLRDVPLLAVDLELTSLDPQKAKITSIGWTEGKAGSIDLSNCYYAVVRASGDLEQSPVIHGLTADEIAQGAHIKEALEQLIPYAQTHVEFSFPTCLHIPEPGEARKGDREDGVWGIGEIQHPYLIVRC